MRIFDGKVYRDMTAEELAEIKAQEQKAEREYWSNIDYDEAVNSEIRKRYTVSQELAILRQRYDKPLEYEAYYSYCEQCKAFVKAKKAEEEV